MIADLLRAMWNRAPAPAAPKQKKDAEPAAAPRYERRPVGVWDNETERLLLPGNSIEWAAYQRWRATQTPAPPPPPGPDVDPPPPTPEQQAEARAKFLHTRLAELAARAAALRARAVNGVTPSELAWWSRKAEEATRFLATGNASQAPTLALEAQERGVTLAVLATKVQAKAARVLEIEARIAGTAGKHRDALRALARIDEISQYDLSAGWPAPDNIPEV